MSELLFSPITDEKEAESLLNDLPLSVDKEHFVNFVLGFPRQYLVSTPRVEIVKHYLLREGLADRQVISSLSRESGEWKLNLITRDRRFLFARIAGTLSCFGMNIVEAQVFANATEMVLDTFRFTDSENRFAAAKQRRDFQILLEEVAVGKKDLEAMLQERWEQMVAREPESLRLEISNDSHPTATRLTLDCQDHFGLLYLVTRCISEEDHDIELAYVSTPGQRARDDFYLTDQGKKLTPERQKELCEKLTLVRQNYFGSKGLQGWQSQGGTVAPRERS